MKVNTIFKGLLAVCAIAALSSCNDISEDERVLPLDKPKVGRHTLVTEFSGLHCSNCPAGARVLSSLQESTDDSFIIVSMQPRGNSLCRPLNGLNLQSVDAAKYYEYYGSQPLPSASFDGGECIADSRLWSAPALKAIAEDAEAGIDVKVSYNKDTREMKVDYTVVPVSDYASDCSVLVWITESNIVGSQNDNNVIIPDYVHNHVFRASANGIWGESIGSDLKAGESYKGSATYTLNAAWLAENCHVVVYAFNTGNKHVLEATQTHLTD
ncbi:MAG: Omp28 family outer membrane lipoprotein [Muribaculum sp.]|nr:Omp28 family outer membrane lipoprotein [Muribaculum sp.]